MSLQAVGWLSAKLGIDIAGHPARAADADATHTTSAPQHTAPGASGGGEDGGSASVQAKLGQYWHQMQSAMSDYLGAGPNSHPFGEVFVCDDGSAHDQGAMPGMGGGAFVGGEPGATMPARASNNNTTNRNIAENTELDADGLPVTKNWYYFDKALNRWSVSPDAPEPIRREFEEKLREAEQERLGLKPAVPPPPPRPPMAAAAYNSNSNNNNTTTAALAQPPSQPQQQQQRGMFGAGPHRAPGPHYAMPTYFSTGPAPHAANNSNTTAMGGNVAMSQPTAGLPPATDGALGRQPALAPIRTAFPPPPPSLHAHSNTTTPLAAHSFASPLSGVSQAPAVATSQNDTSSSSSRAYPPSAAFTTPAFPPPPTALATPTAAMGTPHHAASAVQAAPSWSSHATTSPLAPPPPPIVTHAASYNTTQPPGRLPQPLPPPTGSPHAVMSSAGSAPPPTVLYGVEGAAQPVARAEAQAGASQAKPPSMPPPPPAYAPFSV